LAGRVTWRRNNVRTPVNAALPGRKALSDQDVADWLAFARRVRPLPGHVLPPGPPALVSAETLEPGPRSEAAPRLLARPAPAAALLAVGQPPAGLDSSTFNRLRAGKLVPTRRIDLHGRTTNRAFHALHAFLYAAHADRVRCVEVITGRGVAEAGAIRRELPMWLNLPALRPLVLAAVHPHAANPGSVVLLLRRPK
jgi:DNA-nicking Smr family endonuclease